MHIISVSYAAGIFLHNKYCDLMGLATSIKNTAGNSDHKNRADLNLTKPTYHRITRLEETFKIIKSNPRPNIPTKLWHQLPHPIFF